jgi:hypothetical protein
MMAGTAAGICREEVFRFLVPAFDTCDTGRDSHAGKRVGGIDLFRESLPHGWFIGAAAAFITDWYRCLF